MHQLELTQPYALISVYYKNVPGFDDLVRAIDKSGRLIISTGGTAEHIRSLGIQVIEVSDITQFPEMMGGRVKTLHPKIFGGILGRTTDISDIKAMQDHNIPCIDIVVCNLYPFQEEVAKGDATTHEKIIEKIDIGGPSMIRAAAKNYKRVLVICNPEHYKDMANKIGSGHEFALWERQRLAWQAFVTISTYEDSIRAYFWKIEV